MHQQNTTKAFTTLFGAVVNFVALIHCSGIHAEVGELAEWVGHDLESKSSERSVFIGGTLGWSFGFAGQNTLGGTNVERARQEVNNGVEHGLNTLVFER